MHAHVHAYVTLKIGTGTGRLGNRVECRWSGVELDVFFFMNIMLLVMVPLLLGSEEILEACNEGVEWLGYPLLLSVRSVQLNQWSVLNSAVLVLVTSLEKYNDDAFI